MSKGYNLSKSVRIIIALISLTVIIEYHHTNTSEIARTGDQDKPISVHKPDITAPHKNEISFGRLLSSDSTNTANTTNKDLRCIPSNEGISLLPHYNDPQTKLIRTNILRHKVPPLLISFGGSGNTFTRLLIEYTTKSYTGDVYRDSELINYGFAGANTKSSINCITETIVIKYHGEHMEDNLDAFQHGKCLCACRLVSETKDNPVTIEQFEAVNGKITNPSVIFLIRNPWDAFWAWYQFSSRTASRDNNTKLRHQNHILHSNFDVMDFRERIREMTRRWSENIVLLRTLQKANIAILLIRFEDLRDDKTRSDTMNDIIRFLYKDEYYEQNQDVFRDRIECAWRIMDEDKRFESIHRQKASAQQMNKTYAYQLLGADYLHKMWLKLRRYASPFGYSKLDANNK